MATRGRPRKKTASQNIEDALGLAEQEIDKNMPKDVQNALVPVEDPAEDIVPLPPKLSRDAQDDYEFARGNLHNLLQKGNTLLEGITDLASESDHPRTYEVAGTLLKTLIEGTRELMTLQKDIRDVEKKSGEEKETMVIKNAENVTQVSFEGSSLDLLNVLEDLKNKKKGN
jgi:Terminase DNA packaging enzyme